MKKIKTMVFDKLNKEYEEIPQEIIERVDKEIELLKTKKYELLLLDLISIKEVLSTIMLLDLDLDKDNYAITGSINDLFIAYLLDITKFNPLDYNREVPTQIRVGIHLPEGGKSIFLTRLSKKYRNKVKMLANNSNYFIIDHKNELEVINNTNKIDCTKDEITVNDNILIYLDEKRILTILNDIYRYKDVEINYLDKIDELKSRITNTNHKTVFEDLLIDNNMLFNYHFLSQECKEYELMYFKYYYPKIYYSVLLEYMIKAIPIKILTKYKDNYDLAIKDYCNKCQTFNDEEILSFYKLCKDTKERFKSFSLDIKNRKISFKNITFIEHRVGNGMVDTLYKIAKEKHLDNNVLIFIADGDVNWYISKFLSIESGVDYKKILGLLNPFNYKDNVENIDMIAKAINNIKTTNINISSNYEDIFNNKYDVVIIDSLAYLQKKTTYSLDKLLSKLNELCKEVIIFDKVKDIFNVNEEIKLSNIKYLRVKKKYSDDIVSLEKGRIEEVVKYE